MPRPMHRCGTVGIEARRDERCAAAPEKPRRGWSFAIRREREAEITPPRIAIAASRPYVRRTWFLRPVRRSTSVFLTRISAPDEPKS